MYTSPMNLYQSVLLQDAIKQTGNELSERGLDAGQICNNFRVFTCVQVYNGKLSS